MNLRISREHIASVVTSAAMEYCKHSEAEEIDNSQTYCAEACRRWDVEMMTKNRMSYREKSTACIISFRMVQLALQSV